jgi:RNA polymerase sigma-70 factor (ECF subfamily)
VISEVGSTTAPLVGAVPVGRWPDCRKAASLDCRCGLEWFFLRYHERLVLSVRRILGSVEEAQDIAQEAYVLVLMHESERSSDHLRYLLFRVAKNRALDRIRRRKRHAAFLRLELPLGGPEGGDESYLAQDALERLEGFLDELPTAQRRAFVWSRMENLSQMSIARRLAVSQGSVTRYVCRAEEYCALRMKGYSRCEAAERVAL